MRNRYLILATPFLAMCVSSCAGIFQNGHGEATIFGSSASGSTDGPVATAKFNNPANVVVAADGTVYVADFDNGYVRKISPAGIVSTIVKQAGFSTPFGLTIASDGTLYVQTDADDTGAKDHTTGTVWKVDTMAGGATVVVRDIGRPRGLCGLPDGRIAMSDLVNNTISILDPGTATVTPLAGNSGVAGFDNGNGTSATFARPYGLCVATDGSLLVADQTNNCIRRVTLTGDVTTFAGTGAPGDDNGPTGSATFTGPQGIVSAPDGTLYVADTTGHRIRKIVANMVSNQAGNGIQGYLDAPGTAAEFYGIEGISLSANAHTLWIADGNNGDGSNHNRVRRIQVP